MSREPSRAVTRARCVACGASFLRHRADTRYCSGACRQRAHRERARLDDLERDLEATRVRYWQLVVRIARARGVTPSQVVTGEAQLVDADGVVWMHGERVGTTTPHRRGWAAWGAEAAGAPWSIPAAPERLSTNVREASK